MKYIIEEYILEGEMYKPVLAKEIKRIFSRWLKTLNRIEKKTFRKYRKKSILENNLNAKLRNNELPEEATIISDALNRVCIEKNIIVFRRISKNETIRMEGLKVGEYFSCLDFKGTHVGQTIKTNTTVEIIC